MSKEYIKVLTERNILESNIVLGGYRGSIAHGMYIPKENPNSIDDKDMMFIVIPHVYNYFGLEDWGSRGTKEIKEDEWDIVCYELRKFIGLLEKGNPNVLSMLWMERNMYSHITIEGQLLIDNRKLFATRQVYHSFAGYAYGQLKRMEHFAYDNAYMGAKRKELVDTFGYDTKNAAHLIRLLRMCIEFLNEGELYVMRKDAVQLLEIKIGKWTLEQVKTEADRLFKRAEDAYDRSTLPSKPDREKVNKLCYEMFQSYFNIEL